MTGSDLNSVVVGLHPTDHHHHNNNNNKKGAARRASSRSADAIKDLDSDDAALWNDKRAIGEYLASVITLTTLADPVVKHSLSRAVRAV